MKTQNGGTTGGGGCPEEAGSEWISPGKDGKSTFLEEDRERFKRNFSSVKDDLPVLLVIRMK